MRLCCVLSSDAAFFHQATASIDTLRRALPQLPGHQVDIAFVAINLEPEQLERLQQNGVQVHTRLDDFPRFKDAPDHAYALTCRPYISWLWPDYDGYLWVDSDVRFLSHEGLAAYVDHLADGGVSIVAAQETEAAYCVNTEPLKVRKYHFERVNRIAGVYGQDVVQYCQYFTPFNAGLFAIPADSPIWARYRRNLGKACNVAFDGMLEQDALNVSMLEVGDWFRVPSVMNWLCSLCLPLQADDGTWRHPDEPLRQVFVAHLTSSTSPLMWDGRLITYYDLYRDLGLTI